MLTNSGKSRRFQPSAQYRDDAMLHRQLGLGSNISLDAITVPTEVVLWRFVPGNTESRCLDISAGQDISLLFDPLLMVVCVGGDLTAFVVERKSPDNTVTIDLLMSGNGQYGGLGNNAYLNSQGDPTRVKGISGLVQCETPHVLN